MEDCRTLDSDVDIRNNEQEEEESGRGSSSSDGGGDPARWKETFERGYEYNQELKPQHECRILYHLLGSPSNPDTLARVPLVESYYQPTFHFEIQGRKFLGLRCITIESKDRKIGSLDLGLRESEGRTVGWEGGKAEGVGMVEGEGERLGEVAEEDGWGSDGRSKIRHWGWALEETLYLSPYPHDEYGFCN
ncbi:hypothetical protein V1477_001311 [Vespula maculifrons]|uniref:Uncharacterized protein n=1 Tax=Vespula maculifrons TaxID=7453 RepID=A0ABD2CZE4_VESMC